MGRNLKRVPLDFNWPIGERWSGYINPHPVHKCNECDGLGYSKDYEALKDEWYGYHYDDRADNPFRKGSTYNKSAWKNNLTQDDVDALLAADRLWDFTRVPISEEQKEIVKEKIANGGNSWLPFDNGYKPSQKEVNEWNLKGFGHDSLNCDIVIEARLKREGKSTLCPHCDGSGENWQHPKAKILFDNWEKYDPPTGDGYQLWEDTSEGSPKSPVFESLKELCEWCEENATTFGRNKASKEEWFSMLSEDFVYHKSGNAIFR